jgi:hypothetical protein
VWWKTESQNWEIYTTHIHCVVWGTGTPKDKDEVNRREVCECDGWVCVCETIDTSSIFRVIRKAVDFTGEEERVNTERHGRGRGGRGWTGSCPQNRVLPWIYSLTPIVHLVWPSLSSDPRRRTRVKDKTYEWGSVWLRHWFICSRIKKAKSEGKNWNTKTMWNQKKPIKLTVWKKTHMCRF